MRRLHGFAKPRDRIVYGVTDAPTSHRATAFGHIPALDGLRAVAVLSVVGYHYGMFGLDGGFLGVDLFFVLSGFLITSLLLNEADSTGRVSLKAFWVRRFKRLMPAALVMLIAVSIWAAFKAEAIQLDSFRWDFIATLGYVANWRFIYSGQSYFQQFSQASPVRHAWSLAIEEQFYVVWPLLFAIIYRARRKLMLAGIALAAIAASGIWMAVLYDPNNVSRVYYGTDTRASQLLVGVLLAIIVATGKVRLSNFLANVLNAVSLAVVLGAMFVISDQNKDLYRGGLVAFAVVAAVLLFSATQLQSGPIHFVLCSAPVQFVGRISYGLYLWHWPIQIMLTEQNTDLHGWTLTAFRLLVSFAVTYVSYRLVEMPLRYSKWSGWMTWRSLVILPVTLLSVAGIIIVGTLGGKDRPAYMDATPGDVMTASTLRPLITTTTVLGDVPLGRVALMGDSVAASLQDGFANVAAQLGIDFLGVARPGCASIHGDPGSRGGVLAIGSKCDAGLDHFVETKIIEPKLDTILWMSSWEAGDRIVDGVYYASNTPEHRAMLMRQFKQMVDKITVNGAKVVFLTYPPAIDHDNELDRFQNAEEHAASDDLNDFYFDFAKKYPNQATVLDFSKIACPNGYPCPTSIDGVKIRPLDGRHFTVESSEFLARPVFAELQAVLNAAFR